METITYQIQPKNGSNIQELAREGSIIELREELGLPEMKLKDQNADLFRFRKITEEEEKVYGVLFPEKTKIENYDEFIPEEALAALCEFKKTCPYREVESPIIWHAKEYDPDPILTVGVRTESDEYTFANAVYLIARWGEALEDFEVLKEKAFKLWRDAKITNIKKAIRKAQSDLADVESSRVIIDSNTGATYYSA